MRFWSFLTPIVIRRRQNVRPLKYDVSGLPTAPNHPSSLEIKYVSNQFHCSKPRPGHILTCN